MESNGANLIALFEGNEELSEEQKAAIAQYVGTLQKQYKDFERKDTNNKVSVIQNAREDVEEDVARALLPAFNYNEMQIASLLTDEAMCGQEILLAAGRDLSAQQKAVDQAETHGQREAMEASLRSSQRLIRKRALDIGNENEDENEEDENESVINDAGSTASNNENANATGDTATLPAFGGSDQKPKKKSRSRVSQHDEQMVSMQEESYGVKFVRQPGKKGPGQRLKLDDAVSNSESQDGWSNARRKAWWERHSKPNSYYYRFNDPGQMQKEGKWSEEEEKMFYLRLNEWIGIHKGEMDYHWGLFARPIPGRVGYQCSNFYRSLVKQGKLTDVNYHIDHKGGLRFNSKKRRGAAAAKEAEEECAESGQALVPAAEPQAEQNEGAHHQLHVKQEEQEQRNGAGADPPVEVKQEPQDTRWDGNVPSIQTKELSDLPNLQIQQQQQQQLMAFEKQRQQQAQEGETMGPLKEQARVQIACPLPAIETEPPANTKRQASNDNEVSRTKKRKQRKKVKAEDRDFVCEAKPTSKGHNGRNAAATILPGVLDPVTKAVVLSPHMSPYGHVLGYDTWCKILSSEALKDTCPFTKRPLKRRQLIPVTTQNVDEVRENMVEAQNPDLSGLDGVF